jgi:hypothetical protein
MYNIRTSLIHDNAESIVVVWCTLAGFASFPSQIFLTNPTLPVSFQVKGTVRPDWI